MEGEGWLDRRGAYGCLRWRRSPLVRAALPALGAAHPRLLPPRAGRAAGGGRSPSGHLLERPPRTAGVPAALLLAQLAVQHRCPCAPRRAPPAQAPPPGARGAAGGGSRGGRGGGRARLARFTPAGAGGVGRAEPPAGVATRRAPSPPFRADELRRDLSSARHHGGRGQAAGLSRL